MGKKKEISYNKCYDCSNAILMQYSDDPIVAECKVNHERQVASTLLPCPHFINRLRDAVVDKRRKRLGITDTYI